MDGPRLLRAVFRRHPAGVAVITVAGPDGPAGFTATSVASVSAEPPVVSFGVGTGASSWPALSGAEWFAVHLLGAHQRGLADRFARGGAERFAPPTRWRRGPRGVPVLDGVPAWLVCRVAARIPVGDHHVVLGEVVAGDAAGPGEPLVYHRGRYGRVGPSG